MDFFLIPFEVIPTTAEIRITKRNLTPENILDFGLEDPFRSRGWSGGSGNDIVLGLYSASHSYLAGEIPLGEWNLVVGKARIEVPPGEYSVVITLADEASIPPQPERSPYVTPLPLSNITRYYAGDFHVHSDESDGGGNYWPLVDIAEFASSVGLDFVVITDHNTKAPMDFMNYAQSFYPNFLFVPGNEFTTYNGHMNGIGDMEYVDHKIGYSTTIQEAADKFHDMGAMISINHWEIDFGFVVDCIGCEWEYTRYLPMTEVDAMEVGIGKWMPGGMIFSPRAIEYWDKLSAAGFHLTPIGGSDFHSGDPAFIGQPTTMILANGLSVQSIVDGVKAGKTVIKFYSSYDPMVELESNLDNLDNNNENNKNLQVNLTATVTDGVGYLVCWVFNNTRLEYRLITSDPFVIQTTVDVPIIGEDRWRVEVYTTATIEQIRTMTSHIYISLNPNTQTPKAVWK